MSSVPAPREYFLDSIRAWLMLLGIPFHISLIYSTHSWHVNSATPSWWLTLFNDFIHAFRMQVFFVISGYFSYMLFLRYPLKRWWKVRVERVGIPMLTAIPLLTLPQFILLQYVKEKTENWPTLSAYEKYNTLAWELISHLWFLLVLVILTTVSIGIFTPVPKRQETSKPRPAAISLVRLSLIFFLLGMAYAAIRRIIFIVYPAILSDGMFNFIVMQTLFYVPFFILGALAFIHPDLKARFTTPSRGCTLGAAVAFIAYLLNQRYGSGDALDVRNRIRDYDGNGAVDGERGILTGASLVKLPVRACHLFRECFAVYLSGASSLNAFLWRVYYAAYLLQPDRVLVWADICHGYCVNSV